MTSTPFLSQTTRESEDMEDIVKGDRKHMLKDPNVKPQKHPPEEDDEFEEFKFMELDSKNASSDKLPLPASIREDLDLAKKEIPGPTICKLTGIEWKEDKENTIKTPFPSQTNTSNDKLPF